MSKKFSRDHRTIKSFIKNGSKPQKRPDKGKFRAVTSRQMILLKRELSKQPLSKSKLIFDEAQVNDISRNTRCRILNKIGSVKKVKNNHFYRNHTNRDGLNGLKSIRMKLDFSFLWRMSSNFRWSGLLCQRLDAT